MAVLKKRVTDAASCNIYRFSWGMLVGHVLGCQLLTGVGGVLVNKRKANRIMCLLKSHAWRKMKPCDEEGEDKFSGFSDRWCLGRKVELMCGGTVPDICASMWDILLPPVEKWQGNDMKTKWWQEEEEGEREEKWKRSFWSDPQMIFRTWNIFGEKSRRLLCIRPPGKMPWWRAFMALGGTSHARLWRRDAATAPAFGQFRVQP